MGKIHNVQIIKFKENKMFLKVDDKEYVFHIENISNKLSNASQIEKV